MHLELENERARHTASLQRVLSPGKARRNQEEADSASMALTAALEEANARAEAASQEVSHLRSELERACGNASAGRDAAGREAALERQGQLQKERMARSRKTPNPISQSQNPKAKIPHYIPQPHAPNRRSKCPMPGVQTATPKPHTAHAKYQTLSTKPPTPNPKP